MGESTKIVELYTRRIHDANEMRRRNQTTSEVGVEGKKFSRRLFRANDGGPDILVNQVVQSPRTFYYNLPLPVIQSRRAFRQFISASPSAQQELNRVTPPRRVHNSLVNEWSWSSVSSHIVRHVSESIDLSTLTPADRFACYCDEAFGDLFILDEEMNNTGQEVPQFEGIWVDEPCPLCNENYLLDYAPMPAHHNAPYPDYLRFFCCSTVFHRRCILPWLWIKGEQHFRTSSSCPVCTNQI
ncbi:hypothetical protein BRARA_C01338 [Brassica rapa]|uniref:RING-type domain-containing protein n=1 Tax=Brassica campestris TaxID=3711 RepID=A0A397ZUE5_BRACM|nr:hypothetical protein BRARA_C01338 [Brassica rapa]